MAEETTLIDADTDNTQAQQEEAAASETGAPEQGATETEQSTDTEQASGDENSDDDGEEQPKGAPDKYELKLAEGADIDAEFLGEFEATARELNMTNEDAQKFADLGQKLAERIETQRTEQHEAMREQWRNDIKADKEFGGDNFDKNIAVAKRGLDAVGSDELKTLLKTSGFGDNPEVIRAFYKVGQAISDDGTLVKGQPTGEAKSQADRLYG